MKKFIILVFTVLLAVIGKAQSTLQSDAANPEVDKPCPDFVLQNIKYFNKTTTTKAAFAGKWLLLDFWNKTCGACIASFPSVNRKAIAFKDRLQIMMVGIQDKENQIQPLYAKLREKENLVMPCAFDSMIANRWDIQAGPQYVLIDPEGIVRAFTVQLTADDISGFLSGHPPYLLTGDQDHRPAFDPKKPFLVDGNGGNDTAFLCRSVLAAYDPWTVKPYFPGQTIDMNLASGKFQVVGLPLYRLFNFAWLGSNGPDSSFHEPSILELKDSSLFKYQVYVSNGNGFSYSLIMPPAKATKQKMMQQLQRDLENTLGITAKIEERPFPAWNLRVTNEAKEKLKSKGGHPVFHAVMPKMEYELQNCPFNNFFQLIRNLSSADIFDETGITGNIDIHIKCLMTDIEEVKGELHKKGLELVPVQRTRKVLVIRDLPNQ